MSTGDYAVVVSVVLFILSFAALSMVLMQVLQALKELRHDLETFESRVLLLVSDLRDATDETREVIDDARDDLERFDRVLGSAEAISGAVADTTFVARTVISTPIIKAAAFVRGLRKGWQALGVNNSGKDRPNRSTNRSTK